VRLSIYSVNGRLVRTLIDEAVGAGQHVVVWDGADENGADLGSGIYFARLATGGENVFRKMTLLK
jgi:flagellar hook assembly protein FlgD